MTWRAVKTKNSLHKELSQACNECTGKEAEHNRYAFQQSGAYIPADNSTGTEFVSGYSCQVHGIFLWDDGE